MEMGMGMSKRCETGLRGRLNRARGLRALKPVKAARRPGYGAVERGPELGPPDGRFSATFSQEHRFMRLKASVAGRASGSCVGRLVTWFPAMTWCEVK